MSQTDDIHESFYDLFNQHFRRIDDPERGPRYFTNIAIGAHLKPSRVDQNFQCIVIIKESEIDNTPSPFLNRFEKYFISHKNLLDLACGKLPSCLNVIVNSAYKKVSEICLFMHTDQKSLNLRRFKNFTHYLNKVHFMVARRKLFVHYY